MAKNANSVNIESAEALAAKARGYHHGDLRAALVETGMGLLERSDAESLSLRAVARETGVSATAVYRHFADKAALLRALARDGLDQLAANQRDAMARAGGGAAGLDASGAAYVRFALARPQLFRMIMSNIAVANGATIDQTAAAPEQVSGAMRQLRDAVAALAPPGTSAADIRITAARAWAQVHGLAMLILDGQLPADDALIDAVASGRAMMLRG
ncbi:MAG: TetR/AcrR family transcriptional regulator [Polymorphobacter sp.]